MAQRQAIKAYVPQRAQRPQSYREVHQAEVQAMNRPRDIISKRSSHNSQPPRKMAALEAQRTINLKKLI